MGTQPAGEFVTWAVYIEDRRELRGALRELPAVTASPDDVTWPEPPR